MRVQNEFVTKKINQLEQVCREQGLALTVQRRVLLENLAGRKDHPDADQIYDSIRAQLTGISRTTVYRVLEALVNFGLVRRIYNREAKARYDADTRPHYHAICLVCHRIMDVQVPELEAIGSTARMPEGFELAEFSVNFSGVCASCRQPAAGSPEQAKVTTEL